MEKPHLQLSGVDGNAFVIMGAASKAIKSFYKNRSEDGDAIAKAYYDHATSSDYDNLMQVTMKYCDVS